MPIAHSNYASNNIHGGEYSLVIIYHMHANILWYDNAHSFIAHNIIHSMTKHEIIPMSLCDNSINKLTLNNFIQFKAECHQKRHQDHLNVIHSCLEA